MIRITDGFIDYTGPDGWARAYAPGASLLGAPDEVVAAAKEAWTDKQFKAATRKPRKLKPRK